MRFQDEPTHYKKTELSELQGAWQNLREAVVEQHPYSRMGTPVISHRRRDELGKCAES